jgi:hypothetical protein
MTRMRAYAKRPNRPSPTEPGSVFGREKFLTELPGNGTLARRFRNAFPKDEFFDLFSNLSRVRAFMVMEAANTGPFRYTAGYLAPEYRFY